MRILLAYIALLSVPGVLLAAPSADEVMRMNFLVSKVSSFTGEVSITLMEKSGSQRARRMSIWSKLKPNNADSFILTRFESPADVRGTSFLESQNTTADDDLWVYLPALGKTRRLSAQSKKDSFFGTEFSFGDIAPIAPERFRHTLLRSETCDGGGCLVIASVPVDAQAQTETGYARKVSWIDSASHLERKIEYYDLAGVMLKTQSIYSPFEAEPATHKWIALSREMVNHRTGSRTLYKIEKFEVGKTMADSRFSSRSLEAF